MARPSRHSTTLPALVRRHFGLTQHELAQYLGVSRQMVAAVEAGRVHLSEGPLNRLMQLARHRPPPDGTGPVPPTFALGAEPAVAPTEPPPGALDHDALRWRLRQCRVYALQARFALERQHGPAAQHARRHWAAAVLAHALATPPPADATEPLARLVNTLAELGRPGATPDPARDLYWLEGVALNTAAVPVALTPTARVLRLARLRGLEAEAAALAETLGETHDQAPAAG